jgi:hypothetical protein
MPYSHDLRCGYFSLDLNICWFYQAMSDMFMEFDFQPTYTEGIQETKEEATQTTINYFEKHIEEAFHRWTVYKVIGHTIGEDKYDNYFHVWEYLFDVAELYARDHPQVEITHMSDDE